MKTKFLTTLAALCLAPALHAASFTIDFADYAGRSIPPISPSMWLATEM